MDERDATEMRADTTRPDVNGSETAPTEPLLPIAPAPAGTPEAVTEPVAAVPLAVPPAEAAVLDRFWAAVRRLPRYLRLAAGLARDPRVPRRAKAFLAVGGIYTISPLDLIPGIIPVAGQLDDLAVLLLALRQATRVCPADVAASHLARAGVTAADFDTDLAAVRDTARWLIVKGYRGGKRLVGAGMRRLRGVRRWA